MCYSAVAVANYFIDKSLKANVPITHMHLQKMLFLAHASYFKASQKPLIADPFVAWQHGPVIETLYHALKGYGDGKITDLIIIPKPGKASSSEFRAVTPFVNEEDTDIVGYLDSVWDALSDVETWRLRAFSHKEGGAWYKTVHGLKKEDGTNVDPANKDEVSKYLPRNLTILDNVIQECGR